MATIAKIYFIFLLSFLFSCGNQENKNDMGQETPLVEKSTEVQVGMDDKIEAEAKTDYIINAHMNSQLQIALGTTAIERSNDPAIKEFSKLLVADNQVIQENLSDLAEAAGIALEPALFPEYVQLLDSIQAYSGEKFDSAFISVVAKENEDDIERFRELMAETDNPITREEISANLDILQRRISEIEEIEQKIEEE